MFEVLIVIGAISAIGFQLGLLQAIKERQSAENSFLDGLEDISNFNPLSGSLASYSFYQSAKIVDRP